MYRRFLSAPLSLLLVVAFAAACTDTAPTAPAADETGSPDGLTPLFSHTGVDHGDYEFFQGFEEDTDGWVDFGAGTVNREASGFTNDYGSGIVSSDGDWHARLRTTQADGCAPPFAQGTFCVGPVTFWGTGANPDFPAGGYVTEVDVYLDVDWAEANPDWRFDFSSAINDDGGGFLRDFVFNAGTSPGGESEWIVGSSTNAFRANTFPSNPCPSPSDGRNDCRAPVTITESGWYTFQHIFREDEGDLAVDMNILDEDGTAVEGWTIFADPIEGVGGDPGVGGDRYGWFANQEVHNLPIDNSGMRLLGQDPTAKEDCKDGGWEDFGFRNQGLCIQFMNTGRDSR